MHLKLPTLKYRRLRGDMIEVFKITHNTIRKYHPSSRYYPKSNTRGNKYKLLNHTFHYDTRKYSFIAGIVNIWNSLPNSVVDVDTVCLFKARLDKLWMHQDVWATVCKTVRPMLSVRCLSCLSDCNVYCGQTVGRINMKLGMQVGLGPGHIVLGGDPAPQARNQGGSWGFLRTPLKPQRSYICHYLVTRSFTVQQSYMSF